MKYLYLLFCFFWISCCFGQNKSLLVHQIQVAAAKKHCSIGVAAIHIENNQVVSYQGNKPFFMASTVKVPIAIALLNRVDRHLLKLDDTVSIRPDQAVPGSGKLYAELNNKPTTHYYTVGQLLKLMLEISDNTASDILLMQAGGASQVTQYLKKNGFKHILVNRSIRDVYLSASGFKKPVKIYLGSWLQQAIAKLDLKRKVNAWKTFETEKRDTATSYEMALLLTKAYQEKLLSPTNTHVLLDIMRGCQTGKSRIKKLLPPSAHVIHKTGTWSLGHDRFSKYLPAKKLVRYASDVGILTLPENKGHLALAIYVTSKGMSDSTRNDLIAEVSKLIYDYYKNKQSCSQKRA